jgi:hypothetical protein
MFEMSVTYRPDLASGYTATEEIGGRIESITVPCLATVTNPSWNPIADAINYADNLENSRIAGVPYIWSSLLEFEGQELHLVARTNIQFAGKNAAGQALVKMDLQYVRKLAEIRNYDSTSFISGGDVSLSSVKTSKIKRGARPEDSSSDVKLTYGGVTKNGEIEVFEPRPVFVMRHDKATTNPQSIARYIAGSVNGSPWFGFDARQVLCTRVNYKLIAVSSKLVHYYRFEVEFEQSAAPTWDVEIVYRDQQGKVPSDVAWGTSRKLIPYYQEVDFVSNFA